MARPGGKDEGMKWLKDVVRYLPYLWMGVKVLWSMYKARQRQIGFRDALREERRKRLEAERDLELADRMDDPIAERRARVEREAREEANSD